MTPEAKLISSVKWRPVAVAEYTALELGRFGKLRKFHVVDRTTHGEAYFRVQGLELLVKLITYTSKKSNEWFVGEPLSTQISLAIE